MIAKEKLHQLLSEIIEYMCLPRLGIAAFHRFRLSHLYDCSVRHKDTHIYYDYGKRRIRRNMNGASIQIVFGRQQKTEPII